MADTGKVPDHCFYRDVACLLYEPHQRHDYVTSCFLNKCGNGQPLNLVYSSKNYFRLPFCISFSICPWRLRHSSVKCLCFDEICNTLSDSCSASTILLCLGSFLLKASEQFLLLLLYFLQCCYLPVSSFVFLFGLQKFPAS